MADPARIAAAIGTVALELQRWIGVARDSGTSAGRTQAMETEATRRVSRAAAINHNRAQENVRVVGDQQRALASVASSLATTRGEIEQRSTAVARATAFATQTFSTWSAELAAARNWLARAQERLDAAVAWVRRAESDVRSARSAVSSAESAYNRCQRDQNRSNCNSEARRVNSANQALSNAYDELGRAQEELRLAQLDHKAAQRRVACCEQAATTAEAAVKAGQEATKLVGEARHLIELAASHQASAENAVSQAAGGADRQLSAATDMRRKARDADRATSSASGHFQSAESAYAKGQKHAVDARRDLGERIERLKAFDRAGL